MDNIEQSPFNSSLESGVRSVIILNALFPLSIDLHRLVDFDYLVVHSGDVNGPESLHAPLPMRAGELLIRRDIIEKGLLLIMSRGLLNRVPTVSGIEYVASEKSNSFVCNLETPYLIRLKSRAEWVAEQFSELSDDELKGIVKGFFDKWTTQFQPIDTTLGEGNE
ncbi:MAG: threonine transporter [Porticoccaceae bacterium]|nr:threonine transporter [Porticoccaceae bacterium]